MTVVVKEGALARTGQRLARLVGETELARDSANGLLGLTVEVDPEQLRAAQPPGAVGEAVELLDPIPFEQHDLARHRHVAE